MKFSDPTSLAVAVEYGTYELSSGKIASWYFDKYVLMTNPSCLSEIATAMARCIPDTVDRLVGPELGAVPLLVALSLRTKLPYSIVRKSAKVYGNKKVVEGEINKGERVAIIEDTITTGRQAIQTAGIAESYGAEVEIVIVLFDREDGNGVENIEDAGYPTACILNKTLLGIKES